MNDWKYLKKLKSSKNSGIVIGIAIAAGILALVGIIALITKCCCRKSMYYESCCCGEDEDNCEDCCEDRFFGDSENDADENGCCYTSEKDFV